MNNTQNVTYAGAEWIAYPFNLVLPDSDEDGEIRAHLSINNVGREIAQRCAPPSTRPP